ncbi:hypothetical protein L596_026148 [Steinernema carpocapsae]|uniref:ShKT domain-containing protein n=1 Tax=Steinernema carpocapsae TaxID=34508 RepID=A0A4U5M0L5_STECR|nr:hypothetical protein L596_026148 [Steinernema carpocapsae]
MRLFISVLLLVFNAVYCQQRCGLDNVIFKTAVGCEDEIKNCDKIFEKPIVLDPASRDPLCGQEGMEGVALQCAKTCGICCERPEFKNACIDLMDDCAKNAKNCKEDGESSVFIRTFCPNTCGLCPTTTPVPTTKPPPIVCQDLAKGCPNQKKKNNCGLPIIKLACALTCGICEPCKDKVDCKGATKEFCEDAGGMGDAAREMCALTCGVCVLPTTLAPTTLAPTTPAPPCQDVSSNCEKLKNKCEKENWVEKMKQNCALTCGFCERCMDKFDCKNVDQETCNDPELGGMVKAECEKTCGVCIAPTTTKAPTTEAPTAKPPPTTEAPPCEDKSKFCDKLLANCEKEDYKAQMMASCAKTCGFCEPCRDKTDCQGVSPDTCEDKDLGELFKKECARTCGVCKVGTTLVPHTTTPKKTTEAETTPWVCEDTSPNCALILESCAREDRKKYMEKTCAKSCSFCQPCEDKIDCNGFDEACKDENLVEFMKQDCPKTCGFCYAATTTPGPTTEPPPPPTKLPTTTAPPARCTDLSGTLLPSATICEDQLTTCANIFQTPAVQKPAQRDPQCYTENDALVMACAKTCAVCCERPDIKDSCQDLLGDCPTQVDNCKHDHIKALCPKTCNACPTTMKPTTGVPTTVVTTTQNPIKVRCTDGNGVLLNIAQSCEDEEENCEKTFKTPAVRFPASRDNLCSTNIPALKSAALKCAKTCALCCEREGRSF